MSFAPESWGMAHPCPIIRALIGANSAGFRENAWSNSRLCVIDNNRFVIDFRAYICADYAVRDFLPKQLLYLARTDYNVSTVANRLRQEFRQLSRTESYMTAERAQEALTNWDDRAFPVWAQELKTWALKSAKYSQSQLVSNNG